MRTAGSGHESARTKEALAKNNTPAAKSAEPKAPLP
jgi:hypothetical protein